MTVSAAPKEVSPPTAVETWEPETITPSVEKTGSSRAIRSRLLSALAGGGLLTVFFQALGEDYGVTVGDATQKFLILLAALAFGYSHVDHKPE